jgi:hypothetical protein
VTRAHWLALLANVIAWGVVVSELAP